MKLTVLGSGTSAGVPRVGNDWGDCDPEEPKNRRSRVSILAEHDGTVILVDTSPDLRSQLLAAGRADIGHVIWTHDHADHCHGIDDMRAVLHSRSEAIPAYGSAGTLDRLRERFAYAFEGNRGYAAIYDPMRLHDVTRIGSIAVTSCEQPHGPMTSTGLRFEAGGAALCYAVDFHEITDSMISLYQGCDMLVVDALRRTPHPTHAHLELSLDLVERCGAKRALLTHMDKSMDYAALCRELPDHVRPAYDGLVSDIP